MKEKRDILVTFIVIAYNAEKFLGNCLESLKAQKYNHENIEVILVDSNSNDDTKNIMLNFKNTETGFKEVKVLDNPKKVLPAGWNVALKEATGEAILRVDAHTIFPDDFISNNVNELNNGEDIVGGQCISITKTNSWKEKLLLVAEESVFGCGIADFRRKEEKEYVSTLAFAMYRKKVFDKVGTYNEDLVRTEDNEMHYRMRKAGYKFLLSPNIKTYRYARSNLKDMLRQKYGNGKWIGITLHYSPKCFSIYHLVPFGFVLGIVFSLIMLILDMPVFMCLLSGAYLLFNILNILLITIKDGFNVIYLLLPFILFALHIAYGYGTSVGFVKGFFMKRKKK